MVNQDVKRMKFVQLVGVFLCSIGIAVTVLSCLSGGDPIGGAMVIGLGLIPYGIGRMGAWFLSRE